MLQSRLRPLPRRQYTHSTTTTNPPPTGHRNENENNNDNNNNNVTESDEEPAEDLFVSFLPHLFPDETPSFHGDPGQHLLYSSPVFGDLQIMVPSYPGQSEKRNEEIAEGASSGGVEEGRKLFAHSLWSAALVVVDAVEKAVMTDGIRDADTDIWSVKGGRVLELGAG